VRTLHLTSPLMHGADVKAAQHKLADNVFGQNFQSGKVDGQFGETTMRACKRAKYWLGYASPNGSYGEQLESYLAGKKKLPLAYRRRRARRIKKAKATPLRVKALNEARTHLGLKELPPSSNHTPFNVWYGIDHAPWCAMFVSYCYVKAGSKSLMKGKRYSYVPYIVHDGRAGVNGLAVTQQPEPGDLVCYDWDGDGVADHVGLFERWTSAKGDFVAVEGNTSLSDNSNGGEVMERDRKRANVEAFVHVGL